MNHQSLCFQQNCISLGSAILFYSSYFVTMKPQSFNETPMPLFKTQEQKPAFVY